MTIKLRAVLVLLLGVGLCSPLWSQTFRCTGQPILGINNPNFMQIHTIGFAPFFIVSYTPTAFYLGEGFDALGFNPKDNYIYAVREGTNTIVRLRSDNTFETLGPVPGVDQPEIYAGDCTVDGRYLCHDNGLDQILVFSVLNDLVLEDRIDLYWDPSSVNDESFNTRIDDFAIDPNNPTVAYAYQATGNFNPDILPLATQGHLLQINLDFNSPSLGMVTPIGPLTGNVNLTRMGSLFFNDFGVLYGYGAQFGGFNSWENRLVGINPQTATASAQGSGGPSAPATDGCSCPYSLSANYFVEPLVATCTDAEVTYSLTINNRSFENLTDVVLTDTIPEGMLITGISNSFVGNIDPATGLGTRFLTINNLQIPPRSVVEMTIEAEIIDIPVGNLGSQVWLRNLPSLFDGEMVSDDPNTSNQNDPAIFAADAIFLENVVLDITPPTDCLSNNDGHVILTSSQFLPGITYQVTLINDDWIRTEREITVDGNNTFELDSLPAGNYRLDALRPQGVRCSYEWKDTTIMIEPPNEQLQVSIESNSPLCEGQDLRMKATLTPGGDAVWLGPLYIVPGLEMNWDSVGPAFSGTYELTSTYGACEQIREEEVRVEPAINAAIAGELDYCEREQMQLLAEGEGDTLSYQWSGPNSALDTAQLFEIASMTPADGGSYQVIVNNGTCQDTAIADISILPSPTIELPQVLEADFCEPVILQPKINGDADVAYSWAPSEGLSCDDCPNPEIIPPFLPSYQLNVINDTLCTDSTTVLIAFDSDDLIYVPTAFSPNQDGVNDYFQLFPSCLVSAISKVEVYDRWGSLVFSNGPLDPADPREFWNGRINGKPALQSAYLWQAEVELVDGSVRKLNGEVNLLR
ncbi:MAG: T9SS type B sorting domain-containing protein [Bacteroidota bacterium]